VRAVAVSEYGASPALVEVPDPQPGPGQVLIKVRAAGMNPMDRSIATGAWASRFDATFPLIMGVDVAGVIEEAGENAARFVVGDEVFGHIKQISVGQGRQLAPEFCSPAVAIRKRVRAASCRQLVHHRQDPVCPVGGAHPEPSPSTLRDGIRGERWPPARHRRYGPVTDRVGRPGDESSHDAPASPHAVGSSFGSQWQPISAADIRDHRFAW